MNYSFSMSDNNCVVETKWTGELTGGILSDGILSHNNWAITSSTKLPLVLLFDFTEASLDKVSEDDLQSISTLFSGMEDMFPGVHWICVMPKHVQYDTARMWLEHADKIFDKSHVVNSRSLAEKLIRDIIDSYTDA